MMPPAKPTECLWVKTAAGVYPGYATPRGIKLSPICRTSRNTVRWSNLYIVVASPKQTGQPVTLIHRMTKVPVPSSLLHTAARKLTVTLHMNVVVGERVACFT